jgi:hypothetical protein
MRVLLFSFLVNWLIAVVFVIITLFMSLASSFSLSAPPYKEAQQFSFELWTVRTLGILVAEFVFIA